MNLLSLFVSVVLAAETVISPLADDVPVTLAKPAVNFGQLLLYVPESVVLGAAIEASPTATPTPISAPTRTARKNHFTIVVLGDSMVDTLGPDVANLAGRLKWTYPSVEFTVINHGVGAENIDSGLNRLTSGYSYLGQGRPAVLSQNPDIIVIESFGYNPYPFEEGAIDRHWLQLATMVDTIRTQLPNSRIVIAATIAPNAEVFGDGAPGLSFSPEGKREKVATIKRYIENAIGFAKSQKFPLADAFHASLDSDGNGRLAYINPGDHLHYSDAGRALFAQTLANTIVSNRFLE